ncbi:MAG TPA: hypothetical protein VM286_09220 [Candidatus Thermoplasmatota archaeon]|nr:hypothetical protein [Candidatus Thermoplasmatota archaeon]
MAKGTASTPLQGKMTFELPDGSLVRIQPGPYGKGVSVTPLGRPSGPSQGKGRPPRPSTLELRERLAADQAAGRLRPATEYVDWVAARDPKASRTGLQQTVYRELRAIGGGKVGNGRRKARAAAAGGGAGAGKGPRGRAPNPATVLLRERLAKDREAGGVKEAAAYIRWLVEKSDLGLKKVRPIVYRELRAGT